MENTSKSYIVLWTKMALNIPTWHKKYNYILKYEYILYYWPFLWIKLFYTLTSFIYSLSVYILLLFTPFLLLRTLNQRFSFFSHNLFCQPIERLIAFVCTNGRDWQQDWVRERESQRVNEVLQIDIKINILFLNFSISRVI